MDICRGCMENTNSLLDIFPDEPMQNYSLADMINEVVKFKVERGDKLPQKICVPCGLKAQIAFTFKRGFEQCHHLLCMKLKTNTDNSEHEQHSEESSSEMDDAESSEHRNLNVVQTNDAEFKTRNYMAWLRNIKLPTGAMTKSFAKDVHQFLTTDKPEPQIVHPVSKYSRIRKFRCDLCGVSLATKQNLKRHRETHVEKRKYKCLNCTKAYRKKSKLQRHIRMHKKVDNMCRLCSKSFNYKSSLKRHYLVHMDVRPYICPHCKMSFKLNSSFQRHLILHSGVKPYKCDFCNKNFMNKWNLGLHSKLCKAKE